MSRSGFFQLSSSVFEKTYFELSSSVFNTICAKTTSAQHGKYMRKSYLQTLEAKTA